MIPADCRVERIYCLGSGTETYLNLLLEGVRRGIVLPTAEIEIGFRMTAPGQRDAKLRHFDAKWKVFAKENRLQVKFRPGVDADLFVRGIILTGESTIRGAVGLYTCIEGITRGQEFPLLPISETSEFGRDVARAVVDALTSRPSHRTIGAALTARENAG